MAGCVDLQLLDENTCGNQVVEAEADEECDGQKNCGAPGTEHACRFVCDGVACPDGFGCGTDGVCRKATGDFEPLLTKSTATSRDFLVGDTNADGCSEVVVMTVHGAVVVGFDSRAPGACTASVQSLPSRPPGPDQQFPAPILTELTGNARPELVVSGTATRGFGMFAHSSDTSSTLLPVLYPTEQLEEAGVRLVKVRVRGREELLLFLGDAIQPVAPPENGMPSMEECPPLDGGLPPPPDGGTMMDDGGLPPPPDGGTMMDDGGLPPPPDGGTMDDGGLPPPPDGGLPPPPDGGLPPPPDGGLPPPPDGGLPPPPPPGPAGAGSKTVRVAVLQGPMVRSATVVQELAGGGLNDIVAIAAADIDGDGNDEVVVGYAGDTQLHVFTTNASTETTLSFQPFPSGGDVVTLDSGAKLRSYNASIVIADVNHDGKADLVTNAEGCYAHVAYGVGGGLFNSIPPPDGQGHDQQTSLMDIPSPDAKMLQSWNNSILLVRRMSQAPGDVQLMSIQCPPSTPFSSEVCDPIPGGCEAVAVDLDDDGVDDLVATQGQQVGLLVNRFHADGAAQGGLVDTDCPPHDLATGDFDGDGVMDFAFLDQVPIVGGRPITALKVAYGNALAAPEPPRVGGLLEHATGLVAGGFPDPAPKPGEAKEPQPPGDRLFAARSFGEVTKGDDGAQVYTATSSGVTFITGNSDRQALAPLYAYDITPANGENLDRLEIFAAAAGKFAARAANDGAPFEGLAVVARQNGGPLGLWLLARDPTNGLPTAVRSAGVEDLTCTTCVLAAADVDGDGRDELLLLGDHRLVVYDAGVGGFSERSRATTDHDFVSLLQGNPGAYVPRPLVADLDEPDDDPSDDRLDVVLRATNGDLVAFWGKPDGTFEEKMLHAAPTCGSSACVAGLAIAQIRLADTKTRKVVVVGPGVLEIAAVKERKLDASGVDQPDLDAPRQDTDYTNVGAADVDGDGVDDLIVMPNSSSIHVLRGLPVIE